MAVAVTLLALPLVDIAPQPGESVWAAIGDHGGQVVAFLFTFAVVAIMWSAHNRILNGIHDYDGALFWLNTAWLAGIVLLPWFSALFGESQMLADAPLWPGAGLLYWGTLACLSLLGSAMSWHLVRHPELQIEVREGPSVRISRLRGLVFAGYFLLLGVVSLYAPGVAGWLTFGIIPLSIWLRPAREQPGTPQTETPQTETPGGSPA